MSLAIYSPSEIKFPPAFYYQSAPFIPKKGLVLSLTTGSIFDIQSAGKSGVSFKAQTTYPVSIHSDLQPLEHTLLKYDGQNLEPFKLNKTTDTGIEYKHWSGKLQDKGEAAVFQAKFRQGNDTVDKIMAIIELEDFKGNKPVLSVKLRAFVKEIDPKIAEESFAGIT